jgi:DNA-binding MarR family transcriptional regulator
MRSEQDRRVVNTALTREGGNVLQKSPPLLHENFVRHFESLEDWEQAFILSALQRVAKMMEAEELDAAPLLDLGAPDKVG